MVAEVPIEWGFQRNILIAAMKSGLGVNYSENNYDGVGALDFRFENW